MRNSPFLNLKSSTNEGEVCGGDCDRRERECGGGKMFFFVKVLLDYYRELRFCFSIL